MSSVKEVVMKFLDEIEKDGFNGMRFETIDRFGHEEWTDDRCIFVLYIDLMEIDMMGSDSPYVEVEFDVDELWKDIKEHLSEKLPNHTVKHHKKGRQEWNAEYEIYPK